MNTEQGLSRQHSQWKNIRSLFRISHITVNVCMSLSVLGSLIFIHPVLAERQQSNQSKKLTSVMQGVYKTYSELQQYMYPKEDYSEKNSEAIMALVKELRAKFHTASSFSNTYTKQTGFSAHLDVVRELLQDVEQGLANKSYDWSRWRLLSVSNNCQTCHATYGVGISFYDKSISLSQMSAYEKGEFYAATRQYNEAKDAFFHAAMKSSSPHRTMDALRKWLVIVSRVQSEPKAALQQLNTFKTKRNDLPPYLLMEVSDWMKSFERWSQSDKASTSIDDAEILLKYGLSTNDPLNETIHAVELLRGSALLHTLLATNTLTKEQHAQALYQLGLVYSKIPLFFIDQLPEVFLVRCIRAHPNTEEAKQAFTLFKNLMTTGYAGNSNEALPGDIQLKIRELYDLAYGIINITDKG